MSKADIARRLRDAIANVRQDATPDAINHIANTAVDAVALLEVEAAALTEGAGEKTELAGRLLEAANGHPDAKIPWPHRLLHEAAAALTEGAGETDPIGYVEDKFGQTYAAVKTHGHSLAKKGWTPVYASPPPVQPVVKSMEEIERIENVGYTTAPPSTAPGVTEALSSLLTLTKFELGDNANREPWKRVIAKAEAALQPAEQPYQDIEPGEHQVVLDALAAHNSGEEE